MAPVKPKSKPGKSAAANGVGKPKSKSSKTPPKTKPAPAKANQKKKRVYSEKELGIPTLNKITPAGVQKPRGKKKGKVFVDDQESMMTILAMVNAEKDGQIESKMMKARQMEEIREARKVEAEKKAEAKKEKLEETKNSLRKRKNKKQDTSVLQAATEPDKLSKSSKTKKRVSFG